MSRTPAEIAAEVAAAIMAGPKHVRDVSRRVDVGANHGDIVRKYVRQFHTSGCCYIKEFLKGRYPVYAWQPELFKYADAQRPAVTPVDAAARSAVASALAAKQ